MAFHMSEKEVLLFNFATCDFQKAKNRALFTTHSSAGLPVVHRLYNFHVDISYPGAIRYGQDLGII